MQVSITNVILVLVILMIFLAFNYMSCKKNQEIIQLNERLELRNTYFNELFENSQDGILILDNETRIVNVNASFQRIFQYQCDEIKGRFFNDVIADQEIKDAFDFVTVLKKGETVKSETKRKRKDGILVDVSVVAYPFMLETHRIGVCAVYKDISYKKDSMKALELQKIYFSKLFENSPEAICILDNEDRFIDVNASFERTFGYCKEELLNCNINDKIVQVGSSKEATQISEIVMQGNVVEYETLRMKKDGSLVDVHILGYPLIFENKRIGVFGIYKDITNQKRIEEAVKASEYTFRTLFEGSSDAVFIMEDSKFVDCNPATIGLLGYDSKEDIVGKSPWELSPFMQPDNKNKNSKEMALEIINATQKNQRFEWWHQKKDSSLLPVEIMLTSILLNEKKVFHCMCRDISERKKMEQKLEYLGYHDLLTGLYNRRFFEEELKRLDVPRNFPLTIVIADVNGLKLINDSFGHAIGDELLKTVAEVTTKACRADDIIARLGGDEFVILLPKTDAFETEQILKRIKALISKEKVGSIDISVSFGYETKKKEEEKIQEILKKAEDHMYKKKLFESPSMRGKTINAIINTLHEKNKREEQHSHRVSALCKSMGQSLGLPEGEIEELKTVGLLHDIGKIAIEETILNKPGKLTDDEWREIKRHPEIGYRILSTVNDMSEMAEYVLAHHERWDGLGYPKGLKGEEITLQSRIISIADAYDAMTSERSYRSALPEITVREELRKNSGTQFDPELVSVFIEKVLDKQGDYQCQY